MQYSLARKGHLFVKNVARASIVCVKYDTKAFSVSIWLFFNHKLRSNCYNPFYLDGKHVLEITGNPIVSQDGYKNGVPDSFRFVQKL